MKLRDLPREAFELAQSRLTPELVDRLVGLVSPELEARRLRARYLCNQLRGATERRGYEGAASGRRTQNWTAASTSADAAAAAGLTTMRNRCRDLVRNNPWAERAIRIVAANTVGTGIIPQATTNSDRRTRVWESLWKAWGDERDCDVAGAFDFYGLQTQVMRAVEQDGEVLVRRVVTKTPSGVPLALQVLEADYLDTAKDGVFEGRRILQGVEIDGFGRAVAYWLYPEHPGAMAYNAKGWTSVRVPAAEIIRIFRADRPGQVRGVPWLAPAIIRLRDLDELEDALLVRQKIAACFTAFMRDVEGLSSVDEDDDTVEAFSRFEPGQIELLPPGRDIQFANPPPADGGGEQARASLRSIAAAIGITYESLTGDLSQVNFSSARMGWLESQRNFTLWQQQMLIPQLCKPVWTWFVNAAEVAGLAQGPATAVWTPPRREMIDPVKETDALILQVRNGFKSLSEAIREGGRDAETVFEQMAGDLKLLDKFGLKLDIDPRAGKATAAAKPGKPDTKPDDEAEDDEETET
jgi:lambda family phage portal protein